ncbi:heterokaryon incompatibility protein-domain-containing protein [Xylariaceae sp. AK1471]|nr:heterokaryon incompatibility protein-domain-containing protein [Xylariaceae sp. AK1471]
MTVGTANKRRGRGAITLIAWGVTCHFIYKHFSPELFVHKRKEKAYKNLELCNDKKEIRLLRLQPGYPWSRVRCELQVASLELSQVPKYLALSYTWNEPIQPSAPLTTLRGMRQHIRGLYQHYLFPSHETILINGSRFPITRNLSTALRHLRDPQQPVDFWIDAICINQDDDEEKAQQVQMTRDIYSKAHLTCIWLGPRADGSDQAMDFIKSANKIDTSNANRLENESLVPTRALIALFSRTWWQRVWVIQEALLSRHAVIICGTKKVPFRKFETLVEKERKIREAGRSAVRMGDLSSPFMRTWSFIPPTMPFYGLLIFKPYLESIREGNPEALPHGDVAMLLGDLIRLTARFQSKFPRDKVYGLLGLVPEAGAYMRPNYEPEKSDGAVFKELSVYYIKCSNSLDAIFQWRRTEDERVDAPSWVIDCNPASKNGYGRMPIPFSSKYEADGGFQTWLRLTPNDVLKQYNPDPSLDNAAIADSSFSKRVVSVVTEPPEALQRAKYGVNPEFSADTSTLRLHGLVFDTVTATSHPSSLKTPLLEIDRISDPTPNGWWTGLRQMLVQHYRLRQFIQRWQAFLEANTRTTLDPYLDIENKGGREVAFWRTVMANQIREPSGAFGRPDDKFMDKIPQLFSGDTRPYTWEYWFPPLEGDMQEISTHFRIFGAELMRAAGSRSLIITENGFIGVAPIDTRPGDIVCVIRGYHMPVVIRPVEAKQGVYRLIGNSYVHGIMDGSFARAASRQEVKKFEIE